MVHPDPGDLVRETDIDWWYETGTTGAEMDDIWGPRDPVTGEPRDTW